RRWSAGNARGAAAGRNAHAVADAELVDVAVLRHGDGEAGVQVDRDLDAGPGPGCRGAAARAARRRAGHRARGIRAVAAADGAAGDAAEDGAGDPRHAARVVLDHDLAHRVHGAHLDGLP